MSQILSFSNCTIGYPGKTIFQQLNLSFHRHTVTAILGPNGSGKTTLLSAITDPRRRLGGDVILEGQSIKNMPPKTLAAHMATVPQIQHIPFDFLVRDVVLMGRNPYIRFSPTKKDRAIVEETLHKLNIGHLADKSYARISGGERQLVNIARAVAQDTPLICMDEPTSYLDLKNQARVMQLICRLHEEAGKTIIMTLHDPAQALRYSQQVVFVEEGTVISGTTQALLTPEMIRRIYGVDARMLDIDGTPHLVPLLEEA